MGIEVNEKADTIEAEGEIKVDGEEDSKITLQGKIMTRLEETAKFKELEKIIVDTKEVDNINDKIELSNINESTKAKVKDEGMIITDEVSSIDSKNESRNDVERDSNIHNKSRTKTLYTRRILVLLVTLEQSVRVALMNILELLAIKPLMCLVLQEILLRQKITIYYIY